MDFFVYEGYCGIRGIGWNERSVISMKKKYKIVTACMLALCMAGMTGCQKNPDSAIVTNKDFDSMVEEAENTANGSKDVEALVENYDTYQTTIDDKSLHVKVNADAKVDVPKTSKMSVVRVQKKEIDQEFLDSVREALAKDVAFYDGSILSANTRSDIEKKIQWYKEEMDNLAVGKNGIADEESLQSYKDEYQAEINRLQEEYENAPETYSWEAYKTDNQLHNVEELYNRNTEDSYYSWQHEMNPEGEIYYGVSDGQDGNYVSLYAQNNEDYGNKVSYVRSKYNYTFFSVSASEPALIRYSAEGGFDGASEYFQDYHPDFIFEEDTDDTTAISLEDAKQQAEKFLTEIGLTDYGYYEGGLYYVAADIYYGTDSQNSLKCSKAYLLRYLRNIDGVFVNNDAGIKISEEWVGNEYVKSTWEGESVEVLVTGDGIIGFDYLSPIEEIETIVNQSSMKSFDEIKDIFEQMVVVIYAVDTGKVTIDIDQVILRYTRISEADSFDTGLLVPVWDFIGTITTQYGEVKENTTVLTINAIDGSIIDRELGY